VRDVARDYLGSEEPRHAELVYRWMIGAVARVMRPGCKMDTSLMLVGQQGAGKSTFFAVLGGAHHRDTFLDITSKDALVQLHGSWLYELSELETVIGTRAESRFKAFITSTHDAYRAPYARVVENRPRSCVLCGSTNRREFLTDDTGSRRFWVVPVAGKINVDALRAARDQLWAEAVAAFDAGERWWLDAETEAAVQSANQDWQETDPWSEPVAKYLGNPALRNVTTTEVLEHALGVEIPRQGRAEQMRAGRILSQLGWNRAQVRDRSGRRHWVYER
jgi:putative DNA primase/helicase